MDDFMAFGLASFLATLAIVLIAVGLWSRVRLEALEACLGRLIRRSLAPWRRATTN